MTERLYQLDSYVTEFEGRIIKREKKDEGIRIILDKTYFYPTSGGQQCDQGWMDNIRVKEVKEEGEEIIHILENEPESEFVHCIIDKARRYSFMQQHTGQHILSHCFLEKMNAPTISAHMGETKNTIDITASFLNWQDIIEIENLANEIILKAIPVNIHFFNNIDECSFTLRKEPKFEGRLRIIEIQGIEASACGGTHCKNTREVMLIKVVDFERYKSGYRIEFQCGDRALKDYQNKCILIYTLKTELNSSEEQLINNVKRIKENEHNQKKEIETLNWNYLELLSELIVKENIQNSGKVLIKEFKDYNLENLKRIASIVSDKIEAPLIFFSRGERTNLVVARHRGSNLSIKKEAIEILNQYNWRGGGNEDMVMGALSSEINIEELIEKIKEKINLQL